jgi:hypothetical protein
VVSTDEASTWLGLGSIVTRRGWLSLEVIGDGELCQSSLECVSLDEVWSLDFDESWIVEFVRLGASDVVAPDLAVTESARDTPIVFCTESLQSGQLLCCCSQESRHATWKMCPQVGMRHKISGLL